jgi:hypothetical protein
LFDDLGILGALAEKGVEELERVSDLRKGLFGSIEAAKEVGFETWPTGLDGRNDSYPPRI